MLLLNLFSSSENSTRTRLTSNDKPLGTNRAEGEHSIAFDLEKNYSKEDEPRKNISLTCHSLKPGFNFRFELEVKVLILNRFHDGAHQIQILFCHLKTMIT